MARLSKIRKIGSRYGIVLAVVLAALLGFWLRGLFGSTAPAADDAHAGQAHAEQAAGPQVWTCSMHPQIRLPGPGLCPICNMELIPLEAGDALEGAGLRQLTVSESAAKLMDVETLPVERKTVTATVRMVGKVEYDETRLAYITAWIPGRLDRLFIDYTGVPVREGDHMVSLYSPQLLAAQEELIQALKSAAKIDASNSEFMRQSAKDTVAAAREKLRLWGLNADQIAQIEQSGKVSDHITINAPTSGIVIHKNALEGMYVQEGTRIYTIADLSQVWVKLDAYESDLEWLRYGQKVEFTTVAYPGVSFAGTIAFIDPILDERTRTAKVRVNVANSDGRLKPQMFVKAVVHANIAGGGRVMDAELAGKWMCPMHPEIVKDEAGECDICGMPLVTTESLGYVSAEQADTAAPLVIPVSSALVTGTRAVVYVQKNVDGKPTFEGRQVVLGPRAGDYYQVRSGLAEGELVVVRGNFKIDSALQIMAKPSMMTPEGGGGGGGHQHGGAMTGEHAQDGASMPDSGVTALARHQLQQVVTAAREVAAAVESRELAPLKDAFTQVSRTIEQVDMTAMTGQAHAAWMELSMRLTNDAVEGAHAETLEEAQRVAHLLAGDLERLQQSLGLSSEHTTTAQSRPLLNEALSEQLGAVYDGYFKVQQALAEDSAEQAASAAQETLQALGGVDMTLFDSTSHDVWMKTSATLQNVLSQAAETDDIKVLRERFHSASQQLIRLTRALGAVGSDAIYVMHCPMAFDNAGADWLQRGQELRNPYFGAMMLQCGSIEEVISRANTESTEDLDD
ncbi:MAG: efflux RND transporter periplasmic adaptor subunit [Sedimentisphaerales bacterium]|nr:efflux RND transporter periplasmic adaptor subunit [Sedimentisphaerales bacterium]